MLMGAFYTWFLLFSLCEASNNNFIKKGAQKVTSQIGTTTTVLPSDPTTVESSESPLPSPTVDSESKPKPPAARKPLAVDLEHYDPCPSCTTGSFTWIQPSPIPKTIDPYPSDKPIVLKWALKQVEVKPLGISIDLLMPDRQVRSIADNLDPTTTEFVWHVENRTQWMLRTALKYSLCIYYTELGRDVAPKGGMAPTGRVTFNLFNPSTLEGGVTIGNKATQERPWSFVQLCILLGMLFVLY